MILLWFSMWNQIIKVMNIYYVTPYFWLGENNAACFVLGEGALVE